MAVKTIDPAQLTIVFGGIIFEGYTDGSFVSIERNEDTWTSKTGCDGQTARVKSNNRTARLTVTLQQSSKTNDALSNLMNADEANGSGVAPLHVRDAAGRTQVASLTGWIVKPAVIEYGKELMDRAWTIEASDCYVFVGGN